MNVRRSFPLTLLALLLIVTTASAQTYTNDPQDRWQDWSESILSMTEQVILLAIDTSSEQIHRFEVRQNVFSVDTDNEQQLLEGLQQTLHDANMSERERARVLGDIEAEQQAIQIRRDREALVQEQIAQFSQVKGILADTLSSVIITRRGLDGTDPLNPATQQVVMNVFLKIAATMRRMQLVEMETQLALIEAEEAEFESKTRAQAHAADVYREALEKADISEMERNFDRTSLSIYEKRETRYHKVFSEFSERRQVLEKAVQVRRQELSQSANPEEHVLAAGDTEEDKHRLMLLLLEMRAEILEERAFILEDQKHSIVVAKEGLQQVLEDRTKINQREVHGPQGIIFKGENMEPSAPERIEELNVQDQQVSNSIRQANAQAMAARAEANGFEIQNSH